MTLQQPTPTPDGHRLPARASRTAAPEHIPAGASSSALTPAPVPMHTGTALPALAPLDMSAGRSGLLAMTWAAWCSTLPDVEREAFAAAVAGEPCAGAAAAAVASEASLKLLRLRRIASDDPETLAMVAALREPHPVAALPRQLADVLAASDEDRVELLARARAEARLLPGPVAITQAAVIAYLIGTAVDPGSGALVERVTDRGRVRSVLQALGLPFASYMPRLLTFLQP